MSQIYKGTAPLCSKHLIAVILSGAAESRSRRISTLTRQCPEWGSFPSVDARWTDIHCAQHDDDKDGDGA